MPQLWFAGTQLPFPSHAETFTVAKSVEHVAGDPQLCKDCGYTHASELVLQLPAQVPEPLHGA